MKIITQYECDICKGRYYTQEDAIDCESQGVFDNSLYPAGLMFPQSGNDELIGIFAIPANGVPFYDNNHHLGCAALWACRTKATPDQLQFATLLQQNRGLVYGIISSYCQHEDSKDDLYQEISMKAWEAYKSFSGKSKFSSWIGKIARNTAIDRLRRLNSFKPILCSNILWDISDTEYKEEPIGLSLSIIDTFTEAERRTLKMRMDGMTFQEISNQTGEPINRLLVRMHRIKKLLSNGRK